MSIRYEHAEEIRTTPARAFATIDDLSMTSKWLPPCVSLTKLDEGPNAAGGKLRYVYKQGGSEKAMDGEIVERVAGERLVCRYGDKMFDVTVDLRVAPSATGAMTTHVIEITPKTLAAKMLSPLIKLGIGKQTREAAGNLKRLLESEPLA